MKKIYLAGGWFTAEQEEEHTRIYNLLKNKFDVFNPRLVAEIDKNTTQDMLETILLGNIEGIKNADVVLVIYDGKDTGTIWESGYAYANNKPIVYYAEKLNGKKFNIMLAKTGLFSSNEKELIEKINSAKFENIFNDYKGELQ